MKNIRSKIEALKVAKPFPGFNRRYLSLATRAAAKCIDHKQGSPPAIGMLLSSAIFRDQHLVEPALASIILGELTRKSFIRSRRVAHRLNRVITFDLNNGACGTMQAVQLLDGYIQSGKIEGGLLIAGDSVDRSGPNNHYSFAKGAAAILLTKDTSGIGFSAFQTDTYHEYHQDALSKCYFSNKQLILSLEEKPGFREHAVDCAAQSIERFLEAEKLSASEIDMVIGSQHPAGFLEQLCARSGLEGKAILPNSPQAVYHTAAPLFALHAVFNAARFQRARKILFVTVGAGITTSIALYNQ